MEDHTVCPSLKAIVILNQSAYRNVVWMHKPNIMQSNDVIVWLSILTQFIVSLHLHHL